MIIVVAPDSFKESLSASEVALAIRQGILDAAPTATVFCIPMADGGEGTVNAIAQSTNSQLITSPTVNALGSPITAQWALVNKDTAVIEMASAAGLEQIPVQQRDILASSTHGVGLLIKEALNYPIKRLIIGLGGSATNDAGIGMVSALGVRFYDAQQQLITEYTPNIIPHIQQIDITGLDPRLQHIEIILASDVNNPLCGPRGASFVFGPQKGASPAQVEQLDSWLQSYAQHCADTLHRDCRDMPGAGAAGGLGFAALAYLNASFKPGIDVIAEYSQLEQHIREADLIITGEGCIDEQTLHGKTIAGIATLSQKYHKPLIALGGAVRANYQNLYQQGLTAAFSISSGPLSLQESMSQCAALLRQKSHDLIRLWLARV
ncbi:glycerate kinase family protein [Pelistega europaea]|uniref:Glycerate kinase n=1 Tax=Pelistega europaea TaxID=106147 RepID=A0A7Y4P4T4_9BURK|nr:glycerate kinase [Pelistega europaea]NOL49831.1 glycerate kinase [Pelistega europaea]